MNNSAYKTITTKSSVTFFVQPFDDQYNLLSEFFDTGKQINLSWYADNKKYSGSKGIVDSVYFPAGAIAFNVVFNSIYKHKDTDETDFRRKSPRQV